MLERSSTDNRSTGHPRSRKDAILPLGSPVTGVDGRNINEVFVPKGTSLLLSLQAVNTDTSIWGADAGEWKPERWLSPLPDSVTNAKIPGIYGNM